MRSFWRVFFIGGAISYRALFNWISPVMYATTMLGSPLFQVLFFAYLGRFSGLQDDTFFVVGNAVQICAMAGIFGMTMGIANERNFQTLSPLLATPANRLALFLGRALPQIASGLFVSTFGFGVGLLLGSIGLRARDVFFISNLVYFLMLLFCGVNIPLDDLPGWMAAIGRGLPLTHGIEAAREIARGAPLGDVGGLIATEAAIGVVYAAVAFGLFRYFEYEGRRRASLETM